MRACDHSRLPLKLFPPLYKTFINSTLVGTLRSGENLADFMENSEVFNFIFAFLNKLLQLLVCCDERLAVTRDNCV